MQRDPVETPIRLGFVLAVLASLAVGLVLGATTLSWSGRSESMRQESAVASSKPLAGVDEAGDRDPGFLPAVDGLRPDPGDDGYVKDLERILAEAPARSAASVRRRVEP